MKHVAMLLILFSFSSACVTVSEVSYAEEHREIQLALEWLSKQDLKKCEYPLDYILLSVNSRGELAVKGVAFDQSWHNPIDFLYNIKALPERADISCANSYESFPVVPIQARNRKSTFFELFEFIRASWSEAGCAMGIEQYFHSTKKEFSGRGKIGFRVSAAISVDTDKKVFSLKPIGTYHYASYSCNEKEQ